MKSSPWLLPLADVCLNLMLVFAVLLRLSVMAINADHTPSHDRLKSAALFLVRLEWKGDSPDDLDLYVQDPLKNLVFFKSTAASMMFLDHDDTGSGSNRVTLPDGSTVISATNEETVEIRGIIPGPEYIATVHCYSKHDPNETPCVVTLYKRTAAQDLAVHSASLIFTKQGQEYTAFRFELTTSGEIIGINTLPYHFVK